ncbi:MAG: copper resistance protein [Alphaproteobacteria bacterium]|nr:copper resistance protein [Alphaproteobacteria bacterium]
MSGLASAVRFLHLAASIFALGALAFLCLIARPAVRRAGTVAREHFEEFRQRQQHLIAASVVVAFITGFAGFIIQAALMTGRDISHVFTAEILSGVFGTQYGRVWLLRQMLLLVLAGLLWLMTRSKQPRVGFLYAGFVLAAVMLAALAATGHATAGEDAMLFLQFVADALHLLAAGSWVGALLPLALLLSWCRRQNSAWADAVAQDATRRFSWLGIAAVSTLIVTGLFNTWVLVGTIPALVGTDYGRLLLTKVSLLLPMLAFAATNLLYLRPRLLTATRGRDIDLLFAKLRRNTLAEAGIGALVLMLVAVLGTTPPARHVQPQWPFSFRFNWEVNKNLPESRFPAVISKYIPKKRSSIVLGASLAAAALLPFGYALLRRRCRRWALGLGFAGLSGGAALALPALELDAYPATYWQPAVTYQAISVTNGVHLYQKNCVICHGVGGFGDGPAAKTLPIKPADLTAKHTSDHTMGDLFWWLSHGKPDTPMPGFAPVLSEEERWDLINFLRALSNAEQARSMAPILEPAWLIAPDFSFRTPLGENKTLKEYRGQKVVLLVLFTWPQSQARLQQLDALHDKLTEAGAELVALPQDARGFPAQQAPRRMTVAIDGSPEAFETYSLFRRSLSERGMAADPPVPSHMEFLIDRQGYVRARWIPADNRGWLNTDLLLGEIAQLNQEKPSAAAPDDHMH